MYRGEQTMAQGAMTGSSVAIGDRQPEVSAELDRLAKAVEFVDHSLNELAKKLEGKVLRSVPPEPTGVNDAKLAAIGPSTGYGQELRCRSDRLNTVGESLQDLIRRLEI
jgi:hypothetical protein